VNAVAVTGVSSGLGKAIASHLIEHGYTVYGSVRKLEDAHELKNQHPDSFHPMIFDVRDRDSIQSAVVNITEQLAESGSRLVSLVNNAGMAAYGPLECLNDDKFEETLAVNVFGTRNVTNQFLSLLRQPEDKNREAGADNKAGVIVNISSLSGILNTPMSGSYCISKHAMESMGDMYRRELYGSGISITSIRSGPIQSEIWTKNIDKDGGYYGNTTYDLMHKNVQAIMLKASKTAMPASDPARLVLDIIERRKNRLSYHIGRGALFSILMSKLVPARLADHLICRALLKPRY